MDSDSILYADRIHLRSIRQEDVTQRYCDWLNDPAINQYLETHFQVLTLADIARFVADKQASESEYLFAIVRNVDGPTHWQYTAWANSANTPPSRC